MKRVIPQRSLLWLASLVALVGAYTVVADQVRRPDLLPTTPEILQTFAALVVRGHPAPMEGMQGMEGMEGMHHMHHHPGRSSDQVDTLVQEGVTLQTALGVSTLRVLFG